MYDPIQGRVLLDGIDIRKFKVDELRQLVAYVPQTPLLFNATIEDNIKVGNPEASLEEIIKAAKQAQAHEFIVEKANGYKTMISERGISLSGVKGREYQLRGHFLKMPQY